MVYERLSVDKELSPFIESVFYFENFLPEHSVERVVPTGHIFLLMELDNIPRHICNNKTLEKEKAFEKAWVSGIHSDYLSISAPPQSSMLVVQFTPLGAYPFFRKNLNQFSNQVHSTFDLIQDDLSLLRTEILNESDVSKKLVLIANFLKNKIDYTINIPDEVKYLYTELEKEPFEKHKAIVENYSFSRKHLIDQFKKYHGVTPQVAHRILRFNGILGLIQDEKHIKWSNITYQCGFSDQSHFIKEFQKFCGINPKEYIINNFHEGEANFFPVR